MINVFWFVLGLIMTIAITGYIIAMMAIKDPKGFKEMKIEMKETMKYFVSVRGNIF